MRIPTYAEAENAMKAGTATPLDVFVFENEPAGTEEETKFRKELQELLNWSNGRCDFCGEEVYGYCVAAECSHFGEGFKENG